jgi:endonuclease/exonuclease/phosphatase family metal-dependent hydrolase
MKNTMNILDYNVFCPVLGAAPNRHERLEKIIAASNDFDVIFLQEVFHLSLFGWRLFGQGRWLIDRMKSVRFEYYAQDRAPFWGQDSGLLIFSRRPIKNVSFIRYNAWSGMEMWTFKGALSCEIDGQRFVNTHLQANGPVARVKQLKELEKFLGPDKDDVVIVGDFNLDFHDPEDRTIMFDNLSLLDTSLIDFNVAEQLDYVLIWNKQNYQITDLRVVDLQCSDHVGVAARIEKCVVLTKPRWLPRLRC